MIKQTILLSLFACVCVMTAPTEKYDRRNEMFDFESLPKEIREVFIKLHDVMKYSFNYLSSDMYKRMQDKLTPDEAKEMRDLIESSEDVDHVSPSLNLSLDSRKIQFMDKLPQETRSTLFEELRKLQEKGIDILKSTDYEKELSEVKKYKSKRFEELSFEEKLYVLKYDLHEVDKEISEKINSLLAGFVKEWELHSVMEYTYRTLYCRK